MTCVGPPPVTRRTPARWASWYRSGMMISRGSPTTSASVRPKIAAAAEFHVRMTPSASAEMIASIADSMTERNLASDSRRARRTLETVTWRSMRVCTSRGSNGVTMRSSPTSSPRSRASVSSSAAMSTTGRSR